MSSNQLYKAALKNQGKKKHESFTCLKQILETCALELSDFESEDLVSKVESKSYFAFRRAERQSRAVNKSLYLRGPTAIDQLGTILQNPFSNSLSSPEITRCVYTCAMMFCCANDIRNKNDQKTPGTFFEFLIRSIVAAHLKCDATTKLPVMNMDGDASLPTDLIFDLGAKRPKFHVPVKTSTRERVIQVWAHQRVIDGAYGVGRFLGMPIVLAETKLDSKTREVVEICLPNQWLLYQLFIAQLWGIAYLDIPQKYQSLNTGFPIIRVQTLGDYLVKDGIIDTLLKGLIP